MYKFSEFFISLFYVGHFKWASGTIGSFFSIIILYFLMLSVSKFIFILFFLFFFMSSLFFIDIYSKINQSHDSSEIIIDEFLGIYLIMIFYEKLIYSNDMISLILIFLLFRFFDIVKIFPANWIDKNIKNSFGVIMDDIVASIYTIITLIIFYALI